ncbi:MAG TPA: tetratricopeptide repeat protein, partial [Pseudomonadales bacterium]|nr:tetratricopeptide repeat protein [Pseudomonadales bacterium]
EAYEKYLELQPNDREALKGIAQAYEKQGETDKAISHYDKYLSVYQDDPATAFKQANFLIWSRYASYRRKDAIKYYEMGLKAEDRPAERLKLAQLLAQDKADRASAAEQYEILLKKDANNQKVRADYARMLAQDKFDLTKSAEQYEILLKQDPKNEKLRNEYRDVLLWDDRFLNKTIEQQEYYVQQNPKDFKARVKLAELLNRTSDRKEDSLKLYGQLVKENPSDKGLRREYARLLTASPGHYEEARSQYQILVKQQPDAATKLEAARLLEQKKQYRPEAAELYSQVLAKDPNNKQVRMKRAAIYMDNKSTAQQALNDYEYVLARDPKNGAAHQGAAQALAWLGRPDEAREHAELAKKYGYDDATTNRLYSQLSEGRETKITLLAATSNQTGDDGYALRGTKFGAGIAKSLTSSLTMGVMAGQEKYTGETVDAKGNTSNLDASGTWVQLQGEYRFDPSHKINASVENHGIREEGSKQAFALSFTSGVKPTEGFVVGYAGKILTDSYLALVGDAKNSMGGATQHEFYAYVPFGSERNQFWVRPSTGWVESSEEKKNQFSKVTGSMRFAISPESSFKTFLGSEATYMSYNEDHSGFVTSKEEPLSGGYFSPNTFGSLMLFADLETTIGAGELKARLGPKAQSVEDGKTKQADANNEKSDKTSTGVFGSLDYTVKQSDALLFNVHLEHDQAGSLYRYNMAQAQMFYLF